MQIGKFVLNFLMIFVLLMFIVWAGTSFDNEMTFSWYAYTIVGVLITFYAWTKSVNMNKIADYIVTLIKVSNARVLLI